MYLLTYKSIIFQNKSIRFIFAWIDAIKYLSASSSEVPKSTPILDPKFLDPFYHLALMLFNLALSSRTKALSFVTLILSIFVIYYKLSMLAHLIRDLGNLLSLFYCNSALVLNRSLLSFK